MQDKNTRQLSRGKGPEFWAKHIQAWKNSGLNKTEYCLKHNLYIATFYYWCRKLNRSSTSDNKVVPLPYKLQGSDSQPKAITLNISQRFQVDIQGDFDSSVLQKLINTLESME